MGKDLNTAQKNIVIANKQTKDIQHYYSSNLNHKIPLHIY